MTTCGALVTVPSDWTERPRTYPCGGYPVRGYAKCWAHEPMLAAARAEATAKATKTRSRRALAKPTVIVAPPSYEYEDLAAARMLLGLTFWRVA